jgi:hypothetical protein
MTKRERKLRELLLEVLWALYLPNLEIPKRKTAVRS